MIHKILLVDDEKGIRTVLGISLADSGYNVLLAENGEEALSLFRKERPPIVLTDIKMPGIDGIELLKNIKKESPDTEVIMITGHGDMELAIQSLKYEATDFISKPIHDYALGIALKRAEERIRLRNMLRKYTETLESLVEEKTRELLEAERLSTMGQTVAGLAHAIKNITGGLTGGSFVLEKGIELNNPDYLAQGWQMLKGNVERLKAMALDLLSFTTSKEPDYKKCDARRILLDVAELIKPKANKYGVSIELMLEENLQSLWCDPEGVHRCILELALNALDACTDINCSEQHGRITMRALKRRGWAIEYQVEDNGYGMDDDTKGRIFQRFFSTKGSRGTGLGLMLTKKCIDEHKGVIEMESEKVKGTKFVIRLPDRGKP